MSGLRQRAVAATLWSALEQFGAAGLSTVFMLALARLLTPEDFGVFASAGIVVGFAARFATLGLDTVLVQADTADERAFSTAFWIVMPVSVALAVGIVLAGGPIARAFGSQQILTILPWIAGGMVLGTLSALMTALLRRDLRMKTLAKRTLIANLISGLVALPTAFMGWGAMTLVVQSVGGTALTLILTLRILGWRVRPVFDAALARDMVRFGLPVMGANFLTQFNRESPKLFVGLFLDLATLGLFSLAMRVLNLLIGTLGTTLSKVTLPVLSQLRRDGRDVAPVYLRLVRLAAVVILPVFAIVALTAEPVIAVLLGEKWVAAAPLVPWLCGAGVLTTLNFINGSTLMAIGHPGARLRFSMIRAVVGSVLLVAVTPFGAGPAAAAFFARGLIVEPLQLRYLLARLNATVTGYLSRLRVPVLATAVLLVGGLALRPVTADWPAAAALVTIIGIVSALYLACLVLMDRGLIPELRHLISRKGRT